MKNKHFILLLLITMTIGNVHAYDLMGLSPDAPEDEAGIKKAAENSKAPAPPRHLPSPPQPPRKVLGRTSCLAPFLESLQQLSPHLVMPPPPSQGLD